MTTPPTRVLIVEDNSDDMALLMRRLRKAGLDSYVRTFADGGSARDFLSDPEFRAEELLAVFLDFQLPTQTGLQILEFIRSEPRIQRLKIVLMTSSNSPEVLERCRVLGASFVAKPVTYEAFTKAIADVFHSTSNLAESEAIP